MDYLIFLLCILLSWIAIPHLLSHLAGKKCSSRKTKLAPGPVPLPIVGNLFKLGDKPHKSLTELAKVHGPIMSLQLGSLRTVVISSASMAREVLQKNDTLFCNRTVPDSVTALQHHVFSVVFLPVGDHWRTLRRICNNHVFSSAQMEASKHLRRKKMEDMLSYVEKCSQGGDAVDVGQVAFNTTLNLLSYTFFSVDLADPSSSTSREFKELVWQIMVEAGKPNIADYFPVLKRIDPQGIRRRMEIHYGKIMDLFSGMINQRLAEKGSCLDKTGDALDALLRISRENTDELELELSYVPHLLQDLFVAGSETTSSTVEWAIAELLCNPDKMNKAKEELEHAVGKGNPVKEEDITSLPYLQSVIKETFRKHAPVPFLIPRKTDSDVELCGFTVPKNSQVLINVWAMGKDPSLWKNPGSFEPERFLGLEIDVKGRDFELIPFGAGRRICPGLPLAIRMLPLMLGSLINCFDWKLEDGIGPEIMDMDDKFGITLQKAQPLRAIPISVR